MKKFISSLLAAGMIFSFGTVFATVPKEQIAIGAISPGASLKEAKAVFGQSVYENDSTLIFANGVRISVKKKYPGTVNEIHAQGACALSTPAGVKIGMAAEILNSAYGKADKVDIDGAITEYKYYSHDKKLKMEFEVEGGVITKIECERHD